MVCDRLRDEYSHIDGRVLILLFLEYGLRQLCPFSFTWLGLGLNPTFSGIWSATANFKNDIPEVRVGLNPTFSGIWSATNKPNNKNNLKRPVLILLFLEYGLRPAYYRMSKLADTCLNPTFSGIWSATLVNKVKYTQYLLS